MENILLSKELFVESGLSCLGMELYTLRHNKGISLEEAAQLLNISKAELEEIELGLYPNKTHINFGVIIRIIKEFGGKMEISLFSGFN
ncbi:MAG: helix-turn-helix transcriptional regulator [Alphaproteobacteria bacterium]|nr:helix-turn-helix transcriptional regulator [Alphaproteobacteria bacterium]